MNRRELLLHVGLPKTGTSALQLWCHQNRAALLQHGICYPETEGSDPKHQFLVESLFEDDTSRMQRLLTDNASETLFLSTEGLTNHLYDFRPAALQHFRDATTEYEVAAFMVFREREAWTKSYYQQAVLNPPVPDFFYATDLRYHEFCRLERVVRLTDRRSLRQDLEAALGVRDVVVGQYESDWMGVLLGMLGMPPSSVSAPNRVHISVSDDLIEFIRQLNAMKRPPQQRANFLAAVQACLQTKNQMLMHYFNVSRSGAWNGQNKEILCRLKAETSAQAELIDIVSAWLYRRDGGEVLRERLAQFSSNIKKSFQHLRVTRHTKGSRPV